MTDLEACAWLTKFESNATDLKRSLDRFTLEWMEIKASPSVQVLIQSDDFSEWLAEQAEGLGGIVEVLQQVQVDVRHKEMTFAHMQSGDV
jgi:hypothetical protein